MGKSFRKNFRMFCKHLFCINMEKYRKTLFYLENLSFFVLEKNCICLRNRLFKFFFHEIVAYFFLTKFRIVFLSFHNTHCEILYFYAKLFAGWIMNPSDNSLLTSAWNNPCYNDEWPVIYFTTLHIQFFTSNHW